MVVQVVFLVEVEGAIDVGPEGDSLCGDGIVRALLHRIGEESAKPARIQMAQDGDQEQFVKFESGRKLLEELPHTVDELMKNWRTFAVFEII